VGFFSHYIPIQFLFQLRKNFSMYFSFHNHLIILPVDSILLLLFKRTRVPSPMVSLEVFIEVILPALGSTQFLAELSTRNNSWHVKAAGT